MYGEVLKEAPEGFVPYQQWPEYKLVADIPLFLGPRLVGENPIGVYRRLWPIAIEEYISDTEPVAHDSDPKKIYLNRGVMWQRVFCTETPKGWYKFSSKSPELEGFAILDPNDYEARWSESARRYARKWRSDFLGKEYTVETISASEFIDAYKKSDIKPFVRKLFAQMVERKVAHKATMEFFGARHIQSQKIIAAMALTNSPTHHASHYLCGFIEKEYEHVPAMVGLMDEWYARGVKNNVRFLHFGRFWQKGEPDEWKGFSQFKAKFGLYYISYPPVLWRFAKGRLF